MSQKNMVSALLLVLVAVLIAGCDAPPTLLPQSQAIMAPSPTEVAVECALVGCLPQLRVELRPIPFNYTIIADWGDVEKAQCYGGKTADATKGSQHPPQCDATGVVFHHAPDSVTLTVLRGDLEFSQTVAPEYELYFPNGPQCPGQCRYGQVILEVPFSPSDWQAETDGDVIIDWCDWRCPHPTRSDLRVRQAIAHCVDRRALIASVYPYIEDPDTLLMDSFLPKDHWAYGGPYDDMPQYDPEAGMALLEEAGWTLPEGATVRQNAAGEHLTLEFTTTTAQFRQTWGAVFVQNMAACGIEIVPNYVPATWWFGDTTGLARRDFELGAFAWVGQSDPGGRTLYACGQSPEPNNNWEGQNYMGWCNETASNAIVKATNTLLREDRVAAYDIVQEEFAKDVVSIPLFQRAEAEAWSANLEGVRTDPTEYATTNLHEWTLTDGSDTIVVGINEEPDSLWSMTSSKTASALVRTALGSERTHTEYAYDFQPWLQEPLSTIDSGLAANNDVEVNAGDTVLDKYGDVVDLGKWDRGFFDSDGNEVEFDGTTPITMKQLVVTYRFKPFTWSDGTPGSIADFQLGQKIDCDPDISYWSSMRCDTIQSVDWADAADDDGLEYTVTYLPGAQDPTYFLAPFNPYPSARVLADGRVLADVPAEQWRTLAEVNEMPLSWGPYRIVAWDRGQSITLERNPYYDGDVATPNVIFVFLTDRSQAVAQLLSGEVDYLDETTLGTAEVQTVIDAAKATGNIKYSIIASSTWEHLDINLDAK